MANNIRQIRRQIKSIKNTAKITKAMQMISAVKMQKTQEQVLAARPYSQAAWEILANLAESLKRHDHPFFSAVGGSASGGERKTPKKIGILVLSSNKGLCGALNSNILRRALGSAGNYQEQGAERVQFVTMGKKAQHRLSLWGSGSTSLTTGQGEKLVPNEVEGSIAADFPKPDVALSSKDTVAMAQFALSGFQKGEFDHILLVYPKFVSILKQEIEVVQLLPLSREKLQKATGSTASDYQYTFEPSVEEILPQLLERLLEIEVYQALLETNASEHAARMIAMKNATDNALELVDDLTLYANRVRQAAITQEVAEITSGRMALEN